MGYPEQQTVPSDQTLRQMHISSYKSALSTMNAQLKILGAWQSDIASAAQHTGSDIQRGMLQDYSRIMSQLWHRVDNEIKALKEEIQNPNIEIKDKLTRLFAHCVNINRAVSLAKGLRFEFLLSTGVFDSSLFPFAADFYKLLLLNETRPPNKYIKPGEIKEINSALRELINASRNPSYHFQMSGSLPPAFDPFSEIMQARPGVEQQLTETLLQSILGVQSNTRRNSNIYIVSSGSNKPTLVNLNDPNLRALLGTSSKVYFGSNILIARRNYQRLLQYYGSQAADRESRECHVQLAKTSWFHWYTNITEKALPIIDTVATIASLGSYFYPPLLGPSAAYWATRGTADVAIGYTSGNISQVFTGAGMVLTIVPGAGKLANLAGLTRTTGRFLLTATNLEKINTISDLTRLNLTLNDYGAILSYCPNAAFVIPNSVSPYFKARKIPLYRLLKEFNRLGLNIYPVK